MHCPYINGLDSMDCRFLLVVTSPGNLPSLLSLHGKTKFIIPWQVFPSPVYPALQVQIYDPRVLEQLALMSHTGVEALHSSVSRTTSILIHEKNYWRAFTQALTCDVGSTHSFVTWVFFYFQIYLFSPGLISFNLSVNFSSVAASVTKYETFKSVV